MILVERAIYMQFKLEVVPDPVDVRGNNITILERAVHKFSSN